jgi:formylmethanofuran dehydrogenase subunit B
MFMLLIMGIKREHSQEEILGFSITQIHNVFSEIGQSSFICNLYGFGKKRLVD